MTKEEIHRQINDLQDELDDLHDALDALEAEKSSPILCHKVRVGKPAHKEIGEVSVGIYIDDAWAGSLLAEETSRARTEGAKVTGHCPVIYLAKAGWSWHTEDGKELLGGRSGYLYARARSF